MRKTIGILIAASLGVAAQAQLVMDQIGPNPLDTSTTAINASQDFETVNNAFDVAMIDDFSVTSVGTNLVLAEFVGGLYPLTATLRSWSNVTAYRVEIYSSSTAAGLNLTGDVASQLVPSGSAIVNQAIYPGDTFFRALISMPVNISLGVGTYWLGIIPVMNFSGGLGQSGVANSNYATGTPNNLNSVQANPAGGFGFGTTGLAARNTNCAYRLTGVPVPEPATMLALGAGIATLAARRRRK